MSMIPEVPQVPQVSSDLSLDTSLQAPRLQRYLSSAWEYDKLSKQDFDAVDFENKDTSVFEKSESLKIVLPKKSKKKKGSKKKHADNNEAPASKKMKLCMPYSVHETEFLRFYDKDIQGLTRPCTIQNAKQQFQFYPPNDTRHVIYYNLVGGVYLELPHQYVTFGYKDAQKDSLYEDNNITILLSDSEHKTLMDALETTWSTTMKGLKSTAAAATGDSGVDVSQGNNFFQYLVHTRKIHY